MNFEISSLRKGLVSYGEAKQKFGGILAIASLPRNFCKAAAKIQNLAVEVNFEIQGNTGMNASMKSSLKYCKSSFSNLVKN